MTGYEQSPDYGDPEHSWKGDLFLALFAAMLIGAVILAVIW
jgi:hypothetical protein